MRNELLGNAYVLLHPINFNEPFGLSVRINGMRNSGNRIQSWKHARNNKKW